MTIECVFNKVFFVDVTVYHYLLYFQVKVLVEEKSEQQGEGVAALRGGGAQLKPLFRAPHLKWLFLICTILLGCMFG